MLADHFFICLSFLGICLGVVFPEICHRDGGVDELSVVGIEVGLEVVVEFE